MAESAFLLFLRLSAGFTSASLPAQYPSLFKKRIMSKKTIYSIWARMDIAGCATGICGHIIFNFAENIAPEAQWQGAYSYILLVVSLCGHDDLCSLHTRHFLCHHAYQTELLGAAVCIDISNALRNGNVFSRMQCSSFQRDTSRTSRSHEAKRVDAI
ncbi:predicted protein [Aspergillus nidulans FGSC A4]|uniref:Uncharacterized protein n=1 Tax=Emericella nidulans (strain FGSC A4 / ATCC 38163 / CBS 112.46 / NRRL 194 / M139) TaxID=227321 RepID=Q5BA06_EMENI|nr:hypothetical protein [Aspergillus nidulans FGSC A4]EAA62971.1 predicted protein [Aspergillus nidulans FGSC A4]CBF84344.1 TPA: conserved hypothetical protein [Aspergillus nidulans FGSC A4]|eukprot:XP_660228.1 predicted protein [Aspergillus nidulans FGSC A4]